MVSVSSILRRLVGIPVGVIMILSLLAWRVMATLPVIPILPDLESAGWKHMGFGGSTAQFVGHGDGTLEVASENGASLLYYPISAAPVSGCLAWRWRVDQTVSPTDIARRSGDLPIAVHVGFPADPAKLRPTGGLRTFLIRTLAGYDMPGVVLTYVWGGAGPRDQIARSPYEDFDGVVRNLRPADSALQTWQPEKVDFVADFTAAFGYAPPMPMQIGVSADSDDAGGHTRAFIADLAFGC